MKHNYYHIFIIIIIIVHMDHKYKTNPNNKKTSKMRLKKNVKCEIRVNNDNNKTNNSE